MKILESQPSRYDCGISLLSLGRAGAAKQRIADLVEDGMEVLEIGAGTGTLAVMMAERGGRVLGFDVSGPMLEVAKKKVAQRGLDARIELREMGVSRMDSLDYESFDLVASTLVFSELSPDEQDYALKHSYRVLKPGGRLAIADEARPDSIPGRMIHALIRLPLVVVTFILTQTATRAVTDLAQRVSKAGFVLEGVERSGLGSFMHLIAKKEGP